MTCNKHDSRCVGIILPDELGAIPECQRVAAEDDEEDKAHAAASGRTLFNAITASITQILGVSG